MKPLIVLLVTFGIAVLIFRIVYGNFEFSLAGNIAMAVMLVFTAIAHFIYTNGMVLMIPPFIPFKKELVYVTGIIELLAAIGLLIPDLRLITAWSLILFFVVMLPANIYAAVKRINYQTATFEGSGLSYLWFRIPLQIFFIAVVYFCAIKNQG